MFRSVLALVVLALPSGAQTFTVGPSGDFAEISTALLSAQVVPGSTLVVEPGTYANFSVDKAVSIQAYGAFAAQVDVHDVPSFQLVGLKASRLEVRNVSSKGLIADCLITGIGQQIDAYNSDVEVRDSANIVLQRTTVLGVSMCYPGGVDEASNAVAIVNSSATLIDCNLAGGKSVDETNPECEEHYPFVGAGLYVVEGSTVDLIATSVEGQAAPFPTSNQPAMWVLNGSTVDARGTSANVLRGATAYAILVDPLSSALISGVTLEPSTPPPFTTWPAPARAFLRVDGGFGLGATVTAHVHAPAGTLTWTSFSGAPPGAPMALLDGHLWLNATAFAPLVPLVGAGLNTQASLVVTLPLNPSLVGKTLVAQTASYDGTTLALLNPYFALLQ